MSSSTSFLFSGHNVVSPVGSIMQYCGTTDPDGWVICDGVTRTSTDPIYNNINSVMRTVLTVTFKGSISGTSLTVSSVTSGIIGIGQLLSATGLQPNTLITPGGSGTGGIGTYNVSISQQMAAATPFTGYSNDNYSFTPPDLRSRFLYGGSTTTTGIGSTGGEASHVISTNELPSHSHNMDHRHLITMSLPSGNQYIARSIQYGANYSANTGTFDIDKSFITERSNPTTTGPMDSTTCTNSLTTTGSTGSSTAMSIIPPYFAINYIIKY